MRCYHVSRANNVNTLCSIQSKFSHVLHHQIPLAIPCDSVIYVIFVRFWSLKILLLSISYWFKIDFSFKSWLDPHVL